MTFTEKYGPWAVVTGASRGIGREIAKQLAVQGLKLVLVARSKSDLEKLAAEVSVETKVICADLGIPVSRQEVLHHCQNLPIGLLVNSAGFGSLGELADLPLNNELDMVEVNCKALLEFSHHFAKRFRAQRRGGIMQLSSIVAFQGSPYAATYAATKAYVQSLSEAMAIELAPYGVDVLAVAPGPTETGFGSRSGMKLTNAESAEIVAAQAIRALGKKSRVVTGNFAKFLFGSLMTAPRPVRVRIMKQVMRSMF